jgi:nucleoside-diphosphate kinase
MMERTLILVKPDGVQRGLIGEIIGRFERRGLKLVGMKFLQMSDELAGQHYGVHQERPFYKDLVSYITSGPVVAMVWEGNNAIAAARATMGATKPVEAAPGTIRGDFGMEIGRNLVHGSDSVENGVLEASYFFREDELVSWKRANDSWIIE